MDRRSPFRHVQHRADEFTRTRTIEQAIGYLYSTTRAKYIEADDGTTSGDLIHRMKTAYPHQIATDH